MPAAGDGGGDARGRGRQRRRDVVRTGPALEHLVLAVRHGGTHSSQEGNGKYIPGPRARAAFCQRGSVRPRAGGGGREGAPATLTARRVQRVPVRSEVLVLVLLAAAAACIGRHGRPVLLAVEGTALTCVDRAEGGARRIALLPRSLGLASTSLFVK